MTDWFVRPDASHGGTGDGQSYVNAFPGWFAVPWGAANSGVSPGDTLYVCDAHTYSTNLTIGNHFATSISRITIRGDYSGHTGSIILNSSAFLDANRSYTTITKLSFTPTSTSVGAATCISPGGQPLKGLWITDNTFNCSSDAAIKYRAFNTWHYEDNIIDGNTFVGGSGSTGGGCIQWYVSAGVYTTMKRLTVSNNTFLGNSAQRSTILLKAIFGQALETCTIEDLIVFGNTFEDCNGVALETECKKTVSTKQVGACSGIKVYSNRITNQGLSGTFGGAFAVSGFERSLNPDFGANDIYDNWCSGLHGLTGFCNPLYGTYRIFYNYAENITTIDIDGCGVLPDHGCHDTVIFRNEFRDIHGDGSATYSATGFGILVLDATNITCYGNLIVNCKVGIGFGNKTYVDSSVTQALNNIFNNTFVNCEHYGVIFVGGANNTSNSVTNNIFTSIESVPAVRVDSAAWTGESTNCFYGFSTSVSHTLSASTVTVNPQLDNKFRPQATELKQTGSYLGGKDFYGKNFYNPPNIGAVERESGTKRHSIRVLVEA